MAETAVPPETSPARATKIFNVGSMTMVGHARPKPETGDVRYFRERSVSIEAANDIEAGREFRRRFGETVASINFREVQATCEGCERPLYSSEVYFRTRDDCAVCKDCSGGKL